MNLSHLLFFSLGLGTGVFLIEGTFVSFIEGLLVGGLISFVTSILGGDYLEKIIKKIDKDR